MSMKSVVSVSLAWADSGAFHAFKVGHACGGGKTSYHSQRSLTRYARHKHSYRV
jgi:hypothetical protein